MRSIYLTVSLLVISLFPMTSFASGSKTDNKEGKEVFELTCKSCHMSKDEGRVSLDGKHQKPKAPPMAMVKKRYLKAYPKRDDFIEAVASWAAEPSQEKSLLKRAVKHHGVMPAPVLKEGSLKKVAAYIYDEDMGKAGCGMHGGKDGMKCGDKSTKGGCCSEGGGSCCGGAGGSCCGGGGQSAGCGSGSTRGGCCGDHGKGEEKGSCPHH